jgi:hypothetical protein
MVGCGLLDGGHVAPNRLVITGWESLDDVKKWHAGEYAKLIPIRDQFESSDPPW